MAGDVRTNAATVGGAVAAIVQEYVVVGPTLLTLSTARTRKTWLPSARLLKAKRLTTVAKGAPSRLASMWLTPEATPPVTGSVAANANVPDGSIENAVGGAVIVTMGSVWSIVVTGPVKLPTSPFM